MAIAPSPAAQKEDWALANPWPFALFGFAASVLALGTTFLLGPDHDFPRGTLFLLALTAAGAALVLRLNSTRPAFLDQFGPRAPFLTFLGFLFGAAGLGLTALLILSVLGIGGLPWNWGSLLVVWVVVAPMSLHAARTCLAAGRPDSSVPWGHEAACLLLLAGMTLVCASFSLYFGPDRGHEWQTMRLFLSVAAFAAFASAPIFLVSQKVRRLTLSLLFLLHFGGICSAALGSPPAPWIISQLWSRIYRPYLQFMYLGNAYRFYAPEPDAAAFLWFRLIYEDEAGNPHGVWYKMPRMDEKGNHQHTVALEYQRYLSITTNITMGLTTNLNLTNPNADPVPDPKDKKSREDYVVTYSMLPPWKARWRHSEMAINYKARKEWHEAQEKREDILGVRQGAVPPGEEYQVPWINYMDPEHRDRVHLTVPLISIGEQYVVPNETAHQLIYSLVRFAARQPHPKNPHWPLRSVKVYYVKHVIILPEWLVEGPDSSHRLDPLDPILLRPYFMGDYTPEGSFIENKDPFLFWLLPQMRALPDDPTSMTVSFARRHAGDPDWVSRLDKRGNRVWFAPTREDFEKYRPKK